MATARERHTVRAGAAGSREESRRKLFFAPQPAPCAPKPACALHWGKSHPGNLPGTRDPTGARPKRSLPWLLHDRDREGAPARGRRAAVTGTAPPPAARPCAAAISRERTGHPGTSRARPATSTHSPRPQGQRCSPRCPCSASSRPLARPRRRPSRRRCRARVARGPAAARTGPCSGAGSAARPASTCRRDGQFPPCERAVEGACTFSANPRLRRRIRAVVLNLPSCPHTRWVLPALSSGHRTGLALH